jgi:hypothetical protein
MYMNAGHEFVWYKTVDFATAASQNGVGITQGKCHKMIVSQFHYEKKIKEIKV